MFVVVLALDTLVSEFILVLVLLSTEEVEKIEVIERFSCR